MSTNVVIDDAIRDFWSWWTVARERVQQAIEVDGGFSDALVAEISEHVDAIGDLDWELSPGRVARHAFCLSAKGDPEARIVTELWKVRGPAADAIWEYASARTGGQDVTVEIEGVRLDAENLMVAFAIDRARERIDATFFHSRLQRLPEDLRTSALYLLLDGALGEDEVERWLGDIEVAPKRLDEAVPFRAFRAAVAELTQVATGEQFAVARTEGETGEPIFITYNQALKRIDHLLYTTHLAIDLAILDQTEARLTTPEDAEILNQLEDELTAALRTVAVFFGRETRRGRRVIHYCTPSESAAQGIVQRWIAAHPERDANASWIEDPAWDFVREFA